MKMKAFYKICLLSILALHSILAMGQCIRSNLLTNAHSNTEHSITINSPIGANGNPLFPPTGIYSLSISYVDYNELITTGQYNYLSISSTATAQVTTSSASQFTIVDNSLTFPTPATEGYDFPTPAMKGSVTLTGSGGMYTWIWENDQLINLNCIPLPVELISFTAQLFNTTSVKVNWQTTDEYDMSAYYVQRAPISNQVYVNIGQVTPLNTSGTHDYQFIDCTPLNAQGLYRLKMVDINGNITYSPIRMVNCPSCNGTPHPSVCSQVAISGPSSICNYASFAVTGVASCGYASATWSISPSNIAYISSTNPLSAFVSATGSGTATITAYVSGCGNFTKTITVGSPPVTTTTNTLKTQAYTRYIITVSNPAGAAGDYSWYTDGNYAGTGYSRTYYVYPGDYISYRVDLNTSCGVSSASGYLYYQAPPGGGGGGGCPELPFTVKQMPGSGAIQMFRPPCEPIPTVTGSKADAKSAPAAIEYQLRLLDFQGTVKRDVNRASLKTVYNFDIKGIEPGNYIIQVLNKGVIEYTKKLRID